MAHTMTGSVFDKLTVRKTMRIPCIGSDGSVTWSYRSWHEEPEEIDDDDQ